MAYSECYTRTLMRRFLCLLAGLLLLTLAALPQQKPGWRLTFQDEFDGTRLDPAKWNPEDPWGRVRNRELQAYVKDAFEVRDGILRIKAEKRPAEYDGAVRQYTSGMMTTYRKFPQKFGWFEIRCRVPKGNGLWPAIWMLPEPLGWPPEIDILEIPHARNLLYVTYHYGKGSSGHRSHGGTFTGPDFSRTPGVGRIHVLAHSMGA